MKLGIVTPIVTMLPRAHARWEADGTIDDVVEVAQRAEALGYDFLTCSEHVAIPEPVAEVRGGRYWDPLATFGFVAARTTAIRLATYVLVLGYHHPLEVVKRYGTLDLVSGGRLVLGVGVGSLEEEFALLDATFDGRGAIADDAMRAIRAAWGEPVPAYAGSHFSFSGSVVDPVAPRRHVPLWVGGRTARSLRRAVELADGWAPFGLGTAEVAELLDAAGPRPSGFDVVLQPRRPFDPGAEPERVTEVMAGLREAGATTLALRFVHHSKAHYLEQLEAMRALDQ